MKKGRPFRRGRLLISELLDQMETARPEQVLPSRSREKTTRFIAERLQPYCEGSAFDVKKLGHQKGHQKSPHTPK
jgi:hypothetical protein